MFLMVTNIALPFWKPLTYAGQIEFLGSVGYLMLTLNVEFVFPLDAPLRQMSPTVTMIY
jgi:hypothetical protein